MDKIELLRLLAHYLQGYDPDHFAHGCGDNSAWLAAYSREKGIRGVTLRGGYAQLLPGWPSVRHAWLVVDGQVFDPTWEVLFGRKGRHYREDEKALRSVLPLDDDDPLDYPPVP